MTRSIDYGNLMHRAMRGLIQEVLSQVQAEGLPGDHHFFITFDTMHPDAEMADWLSDRYPGEMTVVLQHWFDNLEVGDDGFSVTLNFGDSPEPLYIPFDAIKTFVDPSVEFGLRFETQESPAVESVGEAAGDGAGKAPAEPSAGPASGEADAGAEADADAAADKARREAEVVRLDSFRK